MLGRDYLYSLQSHETRIPAPQSVANNTSHGSDNVAYIIFYGYGSSDLYVYK
jgi:hypothetical protein